MPDTLSKSSYFRPPPSCPIFDPTKEEFEDALSYINKISKIGVKYGICKIRPPPGWRCPFAIDDKSFTFTPRIQNLGDVGAYNRMKAHFVTSIFNYWKVQGVDLYAPEIKGVQIDVHMLWKIVNNFGGYQTVCDQHLWLKICDAVGLSSSAGNAQALQSKYKKIILPYEDFKKNIVSFHIITYFLQKNRPIEDKPNSEFIPNKSSNYSSVTCKSCCKVTNAKTLVMCDKCGPDGAFHYFCLNPPLTGIPKGKWHCKKCFTEEYKSMNGSNAFGFVRSNKRYTLHRFAQQADEFKKKYFGKPTHMVDYAETEREFWRLVEDESTELSVEYGADLSARSVGSGFPTKYRNRKNPLEKDYIDSTWNLNNLPTHMASALRFMPRDISGMIVSLTRFQLFKFLTHIFYYLSLLMRFVMQIPWVYVGMCFSLFCWHIEDHWSYSINYNHIGEPKTWYGISSLSADEFEAHMKSNATDLFENTPDLLHHMTTMMSPTELMDVGVPIYRCDQFPGEFVITFPRAYHAGFNQGFNVAEAVNFCPFDWVSALYIFLLHYCTKLRYFKLNMGRDCVRSYALVRRPPVFSHAELLCRMASIPDELSVDFLTTVVSQLRELLETEKTLRRHLVKQGVCLSERMAFEEWDDERRECILCRTTLFTSGIQCKCKKMVCLEHYQAIDCCPPSDQVMRYRYDMEEFSELISTLDHHLNEYQEWDSKVKTMTAQTLVGDEKPLLEEIEELANIGKQKNYPHEKVQILQKLIDDVQRCAEVFLKIVSSLDPITGLEKESKSINKTKEISDKTRRSTNYSKNKNRSTNSTECVTKITLDELDDLIRLVDGLPCVISAGTALKEFHAKVTNWCQEVNSILQKFDSDVEKHEDVKEDEESIADAETNSNWSVCQNSPYISAVISNLERLHQLRKFSECIVIDLPNTKQLNLIIECVEWLHKVQEKLSCSIQIETKLEDEDEKCEKPTLKQDPIVENEEQLEKTEDESRETLIEPIPSWNPRKRLANIRRVRRACVTKRSRTSVKDQTLSSVPPSEEESVIEDHEFEDPDEDRESITPISDASHSVKFLPALKNRGKLSIDDIYKLQVEGETLITRLKEREWTSDMAAPINKSMLQDHLESFNATLTKWNSKASDMKALIESVLNSNRGVYSLMDVEAILREVAALPVRLPATVINLYQLLNRAANLHSRVRTLVWLITSHMGSETKIKGITEQDKIHAINSLYIDPSNEITEDNYHDFQCPSINWLRYIEELKQEAAALPFESPAALDKLEPLITQMHETCVELSKRFLLPYNEMSLLETLLPRTSKSLHMLIKRDEKVNRTSTMAKNSVPVEEEGEKDSVNLNSMTGAGTGHLGNQAYASAARENARPFINKWMECADSEVMFKQHYAAMISEELETMLNLRQSNSLKASEDVQDKVVYCVCRSPGFYGMMIQCELCRDWFHPKCVAFPMKTINPDRLRYICLRCQRTQRPELSEIVPLLHNLICQLANVLIEQQSTSIKEDSEFPSTTNQLFVASNATQMVRINLESFDNEETEIKKDEDKMPVDEDLFKDDESEYFQYNGHSLTNNLLPMPELAAMQMNTPDLNHAIKRFEQSVSARFPLQSVQDLQMLPSHGNNRWLERSPSRSGSNVSGTSTTALIITCPSLMIPTQPQSPSSSSNASSTAITVVRAASNEEIRDSGNKMNSSNLQPNPKSGASICAAVAEATANAQFSRNKQHRKTPLQPRGHFQQLGARAHGPGGSCPPQDRRQIIKHGISMDSTGSSVRVNCPSSQTCAYENDELNRNTHVKKRQLLSGHTVRSSSQDSSAWTPPDYVPYNEPFSERVRIHISEEARETLEELIMEASMLEVSLPQARWLWQLHLASDREAEAEGGINPLLVRRDEDLLRNYINKHRQVLRDHGALPLYAIDGVLGGQMFSHMKKSSSKLLSNSLSPSKVARKSNSNKFLIENKSSLLDSVNAKQITGDNFPINMGRQLKSHESRGGSIRYSNFHRNFNNRMANSSSWRRKFTTSLLANKYTRTSHSISPESFAVRKSPPLGDLVASRRHMNEQAEDLIRKRHRSSSPGTRRTNRRGGPNRAPFDERLSHRLSRQSIKSEENSRPIGTVLRRPTGSTRRPYRRRRINTGDMIHISTPTLDELELKETQMEKAIVEECCSIGPQACRVVRAKMASGTVEWIACDHCTDWYHQLCVGIKHKRQVPDHYKCARCSLTALSDAADTLLNDKQTLDRPSKHLQPQSPVSLPSSEQSAGTAALLQAIQVVFERDEGSLVKQSDAYTQDKVE